MSDTPQLQQLQTKSAELRKQARAHPSAAVSSEIHELKLKIAELTKKQEQQRKKRKEQQPTTTTVHVETPPPAKKHEPEHKPVSEVKVTPLEAKRRRDYSEILETIVFEGAYVGSVYRPAPPNYDCRSIDYVRLHTILNNLITYLFTRILRHRRKAPDVTPQDLANASDAYAKVMCSAHYYKLRELHDRLFTPDFPRLEEKPRYKQMIGFPRTFNDILESIGKVDVGSVSTTTTTILPTIDIGFTARPIPAAGAAAVQLQQQRRAILLDRPDNDAVATAKVILEFGNVQIANLGALDNGDPWWFHRLGFGGEPGTFRVYAQFPSTPGSPHLATLSLNHHILTVPTQATFGPILWKDVQQNLGELMLKIRLDDEVAVK